MRIFKFLLLILLIAPINAFGACSDYDTPDECNAEAAAGCYWVPGGVDFAGVPSGAECKKCDVGMYIEGGEQKSCPKGYYCTGNGQATSCPAGTYSDEKERTTVDDCKPCLDGTYSDETGLTACKPCPEPKLTGDSFFGGKVETAGGGDSVNSCKWSFYCTAGNVYPECDKDGSSCRCKNCGAPYEVSSAGKETTTTITFDGGEAKYDPGSDDACSGEFSPLKLVSNPDSRPGEPVGDVKDFVFYAIIRDGQVLISETNDPEPGNYKNKIEIDNIALKNGLDYYVNLSIGEYPYKCEFKTTDCGKYSKTKCTITVSDSCSAEDFNLAVKNYEQEMLDAKWVLDVPVLIAKKRLEFNDNDELYIEYKEKDDECFMWAKDTDKVNGGLEHPNFNECGEIGTGLYGYNEGDGRVTFLGYTIGCGQIKEDNSLYIMLEDFKYPNDCNTRSALTTDPINDTSSIESISGRIWPGINFNQNGALQPIIKASLINNPDKRCFIVGLYGYPPCTPGCYCPGGKSTACTNSPSPFTSKRGSDERTDCYLKSGVKFKEGAEGLDDVTQRVEDLLSPGGFPPESIKLVE